MSLESILATLPPPTVTRKQGVAYSNEFARISALPRRMWSDQDAQKLAEALTPVLTSHAGTWKLRPVQAIALQELFCCKGLFVPLRVGGGKTLITLLAPTVLQAKRPILLIPAKLKHKTERDIYELSRHFKVATHIRIVSYELLGRVQSARLLEDFKPDLLIADEAHKLKNPRAAVTRRVVRFLKEHPTRMVALSGTITKRSLRDYAAILGWCLGDGAPVPLRWTDLEQWSQALDEKVNPVSRMSPGALLDLCSDDDKTRPPTEAARLGFQRRLTETLGVVTTREGRLGCSIQITSVEVENDSDVEFKRLRTEWTTPDDHPIADAIAIWRHARELALGFFYRWNPRPPNEWLEARKAWARVCRHIITTNRQALDSELQVAQRVAKGGYSELAAPEALAAWRLLEPTFKPNTEAVWFSNCVLKLCQAWAQQPGIIWTEHVAFGRKLSKLTGLPFYQNQGLNSQREPIENENGKRPIIASVASNSEGRNLQMFDRNLIVSPPANGLQWEQLLGRTHRDGQESDEVSFEVLTNCLEHCKAIEQGKADCLYQQQTTGSEFKLCYADLDVLSTDDVATRSGFRWLT